MKIPLQGGDKVVATQFHEGNILIFTEYGKVFLLTYVGGSLEWNIHSL